MLFRYVHYTMATSASGFSGRHREGVVTRGHNAIAEQRTEKWSVKIKNRTTAEQLRFWVYDYQQLPVKH